MKEHIPCYTATLERDGEIPLSSSFFAAAWNPDLVYQVVTAMRANARQRTAATKNRSLVRGGGKKPWRQKGTGRARHGSSRSPLWRGGGVTFGPNPEKKYLKQVNKKMRVRALSIVLSRFREHERLLCVQEMLMEEPSTKKAVSFLNKAFTLFPEGRAKKTLIVVPEFTPSVRKSFSNIPSVDMIPAGSLNAGITFSYTYIIFIDALKSVAILEKRLV